MIAFGFDPYLQLSADACQKVVRSEWKDKSAFPGGVVFAYLASTKAIPWEPLRGLLTTVAYIGLDADLTDGEAWVTDDGGVETTTPYSTQIMKLMQTFAFTSAIRKFEAVAELSNTEMLKFVSRLPWIPPRYVLMQLKASPPKGSTGEPVVTELLFDTKRVDLVETGDDEYFFAECWKLDQEFFENNKEYFDPEMKYVGPLVN